MKRRGGRAVRRGVLRRAAQPVLASLLATALAACSQPVRYQDPDNPRGYEEKWSEPSEEGEVRLPDPPQDEDLMLFPVPGTPPSYRYYIDRRSLSLGPDEVVRYVVVIDTEGIRNVLFEGLRCGTREYRSYAYATGDRAFRPRAEPEWSPVARNAAGSFYRWVLWDGVMCGEASHPLEPREIVQRLADPRGPGWSPD